MSPSAAFRLAAPLAVCPPSADHREARVFAMPPLLEQSSPNESKAATLTDSAEHGNGNLSPYDAGHTGDDGSYAAAAAEIGAAFRRKISALRGRVSRREFHHAVRMLIDDRRAALASLKFARARDRRARRQLRKNQVPRPP